MREIKYRQIKDGRIHYWGYVKDGFFGPMDSSDWHDVPSDQYTGLKDKNGQEIYEGDIVKCVARPEYKSDSGNREIYWGHDFGFCFRSPPTDEYEYTHGLPLSWGGYESVEVIGNIYENPDLKEEKENK